MNARERLPNRRVAETFQFEVHGLRYVATVARFADGRLAEVFLSNSKPGSQSDINARDAAVVTSIALQHGVPLETIRKALLRDPRGVASSPLGAALDLVSHGKQERSPPRSPSSLTATPSPKDCRASPVGALSIRRPRPASTRRTAVWLCSSP
jgi:hypothetical protein